MTLWDWVKLCWKMVGCMFKEYNQQKLPHINQTQSRNKKNNVYASKNVSGNL